MSVTSVPKKASRIGSIYVPDTETQVDLFLDYNANTGEPRFWQDGGAGVTCCTGRNIPRVLGELDEVLNEGEARWVEGLEPSEVMLGKLIELRDQ